MPGHWNTVLDVDFRAGEHRFHCLTGWSEPEWTVGKRFTIDLGHLPSYRRLMVRLTASPFLDQRFDVSVNGTAVGSHAATGPFVASFPIPKAAMPPDNPLRLAIDMPQPKRPCDHADSADDRALGLMIRKLQILGTDADAHAGWAKLPAGLPGAHMDERDVLSRFESLGDNCEFGFVQKRHGVQGSSLLRFCATPVDRLMDGLTHGFSGIAEPDGLTIVENGPDHAREYQVILGRYGLHYHTLTFTHDVAHQEVYGRELKKLEHKHSKFLSGLAQGDRIYVLKQNEDLSLATVWTIWLALQRYGDNTLLWVRKASAVERPGQVTVVAPGLLEATVQGFAEYDDATLGKDDMWIAICRQAIDLLPRQKHGDNLGRAKRLNGDHGAGRAMTQAALAGGPGRRSPA